MIGKTLVRTLLKTDIDRLDTEILLAFVLGKDRAWVKTHEGAAVATRDVKCFNALVARRKQREPVAYLVGEKEFFGRPFQVNTWTLIPRPETELLVEQALEAKGDVYWDVGTGSGAIAVSVACEQPRADVLATDVSTRALAIAKQNAKTHGVRVTFLKTNLLQPSAYRWLKKHGGGHLVIAANLPYLPVGDKKKLAKDVVEYEPSSALFSGEDGLDVIRRFLGQLSRHLTEWGYRRITILLEFDPPQAKALQAHAQQIFPQAHITILRDIARRYRLLKIDL